MIKYLAITLISAAVGAVAGVAAMHAHLNPRVTAAQEARLQLEKELAGLRETTEPQAAKLARLERDYAQQQEQLAALSKNLSETSSAKAAAEELAAVPDAEQEVQADEAT